MQFAVCRFADLPLPKGVVSGRSSCECLMVFTVVETVGFEPAMVPGSFFLILNRYRSIKYISKDIHSLSVSVALWIGRQTPNGGDLGSRPRQGGLFFQSVQ